MSRVQLALNVEDLDESIEFWTKLLGTAPHKVKPGYANFASADPPLKLILNEAKGQGGTINHLGIEVATTDEVAAAQNRLSTEGLPTRTEDGVSCCYAVQDKMWVTTPDGQALEVYTVLEDLVDTDPCGCDTAPAEVTAASCC